MNDYESKMEEKRQRWEELAEKHERAAAANWNRADEMSAMIPLGQPILVGHHSEGRHRRDLRRIDTLRRRALEHQAKAKYYRNRIKNQSRAISSDDPEAVVKLREKLEGLERNQETMKAANKAIRMKDEQAGDLILLELGFTKPQIKELRTGDFMGRVGFPSYSLSNNNANIRQVRQRIETLLEQAKETYQEFEHGDITLIYNTDENRVQLVFPGKPADDVRKFLSQHGFKWSRRNTAWQRMLNNNGKWAAKNFLDWLENKRLGEWE